jgi:Tfp pilus assembly protein PilV
MRCCELDRRLDDKHRSGAALVVLIAVLAISLGLAGVWAQTIIRENRRMTEKQWRVQATRLAEAGLRRAAARRAGDPQFQEETWSIPADQLGGKYAAAVRIRVSPDDGLTAIQYQATAEYPAGATRRAQITKLLSSPLPRNVEQADDPS